MPTLQPCTLELLVISQVQSSYRVGGGGKVAEIQASRKMWVLLMILLVRNIFSQKTKKAKNFEIEYMS